MSYSEHFRRKILAKLEEGYSIRAVAAQFEINKNTIVEWKKRVEIKKTRVRKPSKINDDALREDVEKYPDAYQYERAARFNCGVSSIGAALKRLNITVALLHKGLKDNATLIELNSSDNFGMRAT